MRNFLTFCHTSPIPDNFISLILIWFLSVGTRIIHQTSNKLNSTDSHSVLWPTRIVLFLLLSWYHGNGKIIIVIYRDTYTYINSIQIWDYVESKTNDTAKLNHFQLLPGVLLHCWRTFRWPLIFKQSSRVPTIIYTPMGMCIFF